MFLYNQNEMVATTIPFASASSTDVSVTDPVDTASAAVGKAELVVKTETMEISSSAPAQAPPLTAVVIGAPAQATTNGAVASANSPALAMAGVVSLTAALQGGVLFFSSFSLM